jgi:pyrroloquinoline quinone (PQQ) biosynthesis protein C
MDTTLERPLQKAAVSSGAEYIAGLSAEAQLHRAVNHPYLQRLIDGNVPDIRGAMTDFVYQYFAYSADFLRYLIATIHQIEEARHRKALMQNLLEESGRIDAENAALLGTIGIQLEWVNGIPHTQLFERCMNAVGANAEYRQSRTYADEAIVWRESFLSVCSSGGAPRAVGAMGLGTESIVKYIYRPFIKAIERHLEVSLRDRVFFDLHAALDDQHGDVLDKIAIDYAADVAKRRQIREGMLMALSYRGAFFDALEARACAMKPAR